MIRTRIRTTVRAAAGAAMVAALAAGCGGTSDEDQAPADDDQGIEQNDSDASDDGGASDGGASDGSASDDGGASDESTASGEDGTAGAAQALPADADLATETLPVSAEEAWEIALEATGGGEVHYIDIDHDDDRWEWEFEIRNGGEDHELDIDATTGEVTDHERDDDDDQDPAIDITSPMPYQEAIEIALGVQDGRVEGWQLDSDDGRIEYTIDIEREDGEDVEVDVDVETGETRIDD